MAKGKNKTPIRMHTCISCEEEVSCRQSLAVIGDKWKGYRAGKGFPSNQAERKCRKKCKTKEN